MAWIDDRVWCHPKLTDATDKAAWTWVKGIAYSSGFATGGRLSLGQQKAVGTTPKTRKELISRGLWDEAPDSPCGGQDGDVLIHDWDSHNSKRDERRKLDRERKKKAREVSQSGGVSAGTSAGTSSGASAGNGADKVADGSALNARRRPPDDGSEGSEGKPKAVTSSRDDAHANPFAARDTNGTAHGIIHMGEFIDRELAKTREAS